MITEAAVWAHAGASLMMAGLLWFVQIVHYPLFARAAGDAEGWKAYESEHQSRTTLVVGPLMLVEAATALLLLVLRPEGVDLALLIASVVLVGVVWALTFFFAVPLHARLSGGFDAAVHRSLVAVNWPRTIAWTARSAVSLLIVRQFLVASHGAM